MARRSRPLLCWVAAAFLTLYLHSVSAFNMDLDNIMEYRGRDDSSMFGFAVALHKEEGTNWVLVGAPEAQSRAQQRVRRGGVVYRCDPWRSFACDELQFDRSEGNNLNATRHDMDNKSHQWFGATLVASPGGDAVVACAPRYVNYPRINDERHEPVGTCWVARRQFRETNEFSPCRTSHWGYHRQGYCQAGFSAAIDSEGRRLFMGAPGSRYWQGQAYSLDSTVFMPFMPPERVQVDSNTGQLFIQNLHQRPDLYLTPEGAAQFDDTYLGYSMAVGYFHEDGELFLAVGRPKGNQLTGKVEVYFYNLTMDYDIKGDQLGSYFGYSICTSDIDGDSVDDIIVGAPLFTQPNNEGKYETGQIYVFNDGELSATREGFNSKSRFGLALASLGDINLDGFGDIAVGAPYDNPEGRGAVYIYLGSNNGLREKPSQIITAKDVSNSLTTFGFSVNGGLDLDDNEYPDMVVGAYEANYASFFRARPIVNVDASVEFAIANKSITLERTNCILDDRTPTICTSIKTCIVYRGNNVDSSQNFTLQLVLDAANTKEPRLYFRNSPQRFVETSRNFTMSLAADLRYCRDFPVYLKPNIRDKLTPIHVELRYNLIKAPIRRRSGRDIHLAPVLDLANEPVRKDTLHIYKNCGEDQKCIPDLWLTVTPSVEKYLLGSGEDLNLTVLVDNREEDAFEAVYNLKVPHGLNFVKIHRMDRNKDVVIQCSPPSVKSNNTLKCDIGNPLPGKKYVQFVVQMKPYYAEGLKSPFSFIMNTNSSNPEKPNPRKKLTQTLNITVDVQFDITLDGASNPAEVYWSSADYNKESDFSYESDIGPLVVHVHTLHNKGPADILAGKVYFDIPSSVLAGDRLLYILQQPNTEGPIQCHFPSDTRPNPLGLKLERRKAYLDSDSEYSSSSYSSSSSSSGTAYSEVSQGQTRGGSTATSEEDAPSEGGRRGGSRTHTLVGLETERTLRRDEGLEHDAGGYEGYGSSHSSHHSSSSSHNRSEHSRRVETHDGSGKPYVHSSRNVSVSWSENGEPVHYNRSYTFGNTTIVDSSHGQGQGQVHHNRGGEEHDDHDEYDMYEEDSHRRGGSTDFSGSTGTHSSRGGAHYDGAHHSQQSNQTGGTFTHYSTSWSSSGGREFNSSSGNRNSGSTGYDRQWSSSSDSQGHDNVDERYRSGSGQNSRDNVDERFQSRGGQSSHDNVDERFQSSGGQNSRDNVDERFRSSGGQNSHDNVDERFRSRGGQSSHDNVDERFRSSSGQNSHDNVDERYRGRGGQSSRDNVDVSGRGQYGHDNVDDTYQGRGRDNVDESYRGRGGQYGHDNVDTTHRSGSGSGQYGNLDHRSRTRGQHSNEEGSYSRENERDYSSQDHSRSGYGRGQDEYSYSRSLWSEGHGQGSGQSGSQHRTSGNRDQRVNEQDAHGGTQFYTSSVLLGSDGNVDLGYAARGHYGRQDSRQQSRSSEARKHPVDPDLSDAGARFGDDNHQSSDKDENSGLTLYNRFKRQVPEDEYPKELKECNATNCIRISCDLGRLEKGKEVHVEFRMRVWVPTMKKLWANKVIKTSSQMAVQVTKVPYLGKPAESKLRTHEVFTDIRSSDSPTPPDIIPLWIVVLSAVAGTMILLLIIFILYKFGFFKRNRPSDAAEKEPLNRNGHYSAGDEAL